MRHQNNNRAMIVEVEIRLGRSVVIGGGARGRLPGRSVRSHRRSSGRHHVNHAMKHDAAVMTGGQSDKWANVSRTRRLRHAWTMMRKKAFFRLRHAPLVSPCLCGTQGPFELAGREARHDREQMGGETGRAGGVLLGDLVEAGVRASMSGRGRRTFATTDRRSRTAR